MMPGFLDKENIPEEVSLSRVEEMAWTTWLCGRVGTNILSTQNIKVFKAEANLT